MTVIFEIELPDGNILEIEAPENTPPEQIKAKARQYLATQSAPKESPSALYQRAMRGDANARDEYNRRATAVGQNTLEQDREAYNPTTGGDNFVAGVGKAFVDTGRGIKQLFGGMDKADISRQRELDAPLMNTGAGQAGVVAGNIAMWANPVAVGPRALSVGGKLLNAAAGGAAIGGVQPVAEGESRLDNAAMGAAWGGGGQAVASGLGAVGRALPRGESEKRAAVQYGKSIGVNLGATDLAEKGFIKNVTSQMERLPLSGGRARQASNEQAITKAVAGELGLKADKLTPRVFGKRMGEIGDDFNRLSEKNSLVLDKQLIDDLARVQKESDELVGTGQLSQNWIDSLISKADETGTISGKAYKSFDSNLGKIIKTGGEKAYALGELRDTVRGAMDRSISPEDAAEWARIRKQYAVGKTIEPLVAKTKDGIIPPSQLMGRMTADKMGKTRMAQNRAGEMGRLARLGQYMKEAPDSGTADRALVNLAVPSALYGAQAGGFIDPSTAVALGGGLMANRLGLKAINSVANKGAPQTLTGLSRLVGQGSQRTLPATAVAASSAIAAPADFNAELESQVRGGQISKAQAAERLDAYLQNYSAQNGIEATREVYKQFPGWSQVMNN